MAILGLLAAGALLLLLAVLGWRLARATRRSTGYGAITEEQARQNAAPLTTAIVSGSRTHEKKRG
jgi:Flp pilus assembly protein TadB